MTATYYTQWGFKCVRLEGVPEAEDHWYLIDLYPDCALITFKPV